MNNNENNNNNNLDMNQSMNENVKEYYVTKLEKYEELNEQARKSVYVSSILVSLCALMLVYSATIDVEDISMFGGIIASLTGIVGIYSLACDIAKKVGLESRINAIKEKLEIYNLQNNQNFDESQENIGYYKGMRKTK